MASLGSDIRHLVNAIQARLNGHPDSAEEWRTIHRQLRAASDKARKVTKLAERMESTTNYPVRDTNAAHEAFGNTRVT